MKKSIIRVEHLSHRYSVQWAVRDLSFELPEKGIYGLLGSNGAGKSTTMNIICGVIRQTEGNVFIKGIDTRKEPVAAKQNIGFLPQKPPVYGDLTVQEYLVYTADLRLVPDAEVGIHVDEVLEKCGIAHFRHRLIKNLSGGYQQRVGIAQAIVHRPDLVIFDEPTNGLDPNQIVEIRELIREIACDRSVILSTHILSEVQQLCDHILMIEQGKLVFNGTVDDFNNTVSPGTIFIAFGGEPDELLLRELPGVTGLISLGAWNYRLGYTNSREVMERLIALCASQQWPVTEIRIEKSSMDTAFAAFTQKV